MRSAGITGHVVVITDPRIKPPTLDLLLTNDGLPKDHLVLSLNPGLLGVQGIYTFRRIYQCVLRDIY